MMKWMMKNTSLKMRMKEKKLKQKKMRMRILWDRKVILMLIMKTMMKMMKTKNMIVVKILDQNYLKKVMQIVIN